MPTTLTPTDTQPRPGPAEAGAALSRGERVVLQLLRQQSATLPELGALTKKSRAVLHRDVEALIERGLVAGDDADDPMCRRFAAIDG